MKEATTLKRKGDIVVDQETNTHDIRLYGTHVRNLEDGEEVGEGIHRFILPTPFEDPEFVEGALTCTVAEWSVEDSATGFLVGCYVHNLLFGTNTAIVDVLVRTHNAVVVAVNIEGRIVDKKNLTL